MRICQELNANYSHFLFGKNTRPGKQQNTPADGPRGCSMLSLSAVDELVLQEGGDQRQNEGGNAPGETFLLLFGGFFLSGRLFQRHDQGVEVVKQCLEHIFRALHTGLFLIRQRGRTQSVSEV